MGELVGSRSGETARARMNKFVCLALFASSALAAPAPQDTSALVDTILSQLDGPIDAAIQAALGGSGTKSVKTPGKLGNFQGTFTQGPAVSVSTSGSFALPGATGKFSSSSSSKESSSSFSSSSSSSSSGSVGEWSAWTSVGTTGQTVPRPVADVPAVTTQVSQVSSEQAVISSVVKQLEGSISAAVEAALSGSQNTATTAVQPAPAPAPAKPARQQAAAAAAAAAEAARLEEQRRQ